VLLVLGNRLMDRAGGTEVHLLTIGEELRRLGHEVVVYSPEVGAFADYVSARGVPVVDRLRDLPAECDVVFAQDRLVVFDLAERYSNAFTVFRVCGDVHEFQLPPQVDGLVDLVVVLSERYRRAAQACSVQAPVLRLRTPIDVDRLVPHGGLRDTPKRAAVLGNYPERIDVVRQAFEGAGIELVEIGGAQQRYDIAEAVADADIVVAKSRAALDAMACGKAVYVFDVFGGDGWVTPESYPAMEADHFAGLATGRVLDADQIAADLADYHPGMGVANRDLVVQHHRVRDHVVEFLEAIPEGRVADRATTPYAELSRLVALQWAWVEAAQTARGHLSWAHQRLLEEERAVAELHVTLGEERRRADDATVAAQSAGAALRDVEMERDSAAQRVAELEEELERILVSRAFRFSTAYWRGRDWLLGP
jgi:glycosyltransferase involved in cell wall biosynthesis